MATKDDELVKKIRAGINQSSFMTPMANFLVTECAVIAIIVAIILWLATGSFWGFALGICIIPVITGMTLFSKFDIVAYVFLGGCWAAPFIALGIYWSNAFYLFAFIAFCVSFVVHYWGIKYFRDLNSN